MARNGKALVTAPYSSCCDRDLELGKRSRARSAQTSSSRAITGGRFLGFRGLFLRLRRRRRPLDAIHLHEPAALEVIDAGPRAALIAYDRGAIAVGIAAELDAVRRAGAGGHLAFGHAETDTFAKRRRVCAGGPRTAGWTAGGRLRHRRRGRTAAIGID